MLGCRAGLMLGAALMTVGVVGCGGGGAQSKPTAHLNGTVRINGQSVPSDAEAYVDFFPMGGGQAHPTSAKIVAGKYDAPNVPQGKVTALFKISRLTGRMIREDGGSPFAEMEDLVPLEARQGIAMEVTGDAQRDFDL